MRGCPAISYGWGRGHVRAHNRAFRRFGLAQVAATPGRAPRGASSTALEQGRIAVDFSDLPSAASFVLAEADGAQRMRARTAAAALGLGAAGAWCAPAAAPVVPAVAELFGIPLRAPRRGVALTFDDGPHPEGTPGGARPARARRRRRRPSTSSASRSSGDPALAAEIAAAGHEIGIHGYRHTLLLRRSRRAALRDDFDRAAAVIGEATGATSLSYRPPYGVFSLAGLRLARERWAPLLWSHWGRDWEARATPSSIAARATRGLGAGRGRAAARQRRLQRRRVVASDGGGAAGGARGGARDRRAVRHGEPVDVAADALARSSSAARQPSSAAARSPEARPNSRSTGRSGPCSTGTSATSSRTVSAICRHADELVADEVVDPARRRPARAPRRCPRRDPRRRRTGASALPSPAIVSGVAGLRLADERRARRPPGGRAARTGCRSGGSSSRRRTSSRRSGSTSRRRASSPCRGAAAARAACPRRAARGPARCRRPRSCSRRGSATTPSARAASSRLKVPRDVDGVGAHRVARRPG